MSVQLFLQKIPAYAIKCQCVQLRKILKNVQTNYFIQKEEQRKILISVVLIVNIAFIFYRSALNEPRISETVPH